MGAADGRPVGASVGVAVGSLVGVAVGVAVGFRVGTAVGPKVGFAVGIEVGTAVSTISKYLYRLAFIHGAVQKNEAEHPTGISFAQADGGRAYAPVNVPFTRNRWTNGVPSGTRDDLNHPVALPVPLLTVPEFTQDVHEIAFARVMPSVVQKSTVTVTGSGKCGRYQMYSS